MPQTQPHSRKAKQDMVPLRISDLSAYDHVGVPEVVLSRGLVVDFTPAEAKKLLALRDEHGRPICEECS